MHKKHEDRRLIKTLLSKRPHPQAALVAGIFLLLCAVASQMTFAHWSMAEFLKANWNLVFIQGEYWRLFTTTFVHGDWQHFLSNSFMLGILGFFVFGYFGGFIFPLLAILFGGLINAITLYFYAHPITQYNGVKLASSSNTYLVGASGVVYFLAGFWLVNYIFIERTRTLPIRLLRTIGIALVILFPTSFEPQTSYLAHLVGVIVGTLAGIVYFFTHRHHIRSHEVWIEIPELAEVSNQE